MCAAAVCATCVVAAHGHGVVELGLAWDMPRVRFGSAEKEHRRWVPAGKGWLLSALGVSTLGQPTQLCLWGGGLQGWAARQHTHEANPNLI